MQMNSLKSLDTQKLIQKMKKIMCATVRRMIKEQPTAYDVNGVANELKRGKFIESETVLSDVHQGYNVGLNRAIDIMKGDRNGL